MPRTSQRIWATGRCSRCQLMPGNFSAKQMPRSLLGYVPPVPMPPLPCPQLCTPADNRNGNVSNHAHCPVLRQIMWSARPVWNTQCIRANRDIAKLSIQAPRATHSLAMCYRKLALGFSLGVSVGAPTRVHCLRRSLCRLDGIFNLGSVWSQKRPVPDSPSPLILKVIRQAIRVHAFSISSDWVFHM